MPLMYALEAGFLVPGTLLETDYSAVNSNVRSVVYER